MLRDSLRKHHKKATEFKSGSGAKGQKKWYLCNNLLFLLPFVEDQNSSTTSNLVEGPDIDEESQQATLLLEDILDGRPSPGVANSPIENIEAEPSVSSDFDDAQPLLNTAPNVRPPNTLQRKKRLYPQERRSTLSPFDTEMLSALKSLQQQQLQKLHRVPHDDDEQFLLSFLPVLRSLGPISKFEFAES